MRNNLLSKNTFQSPVLKIHSSKIIKIVPI